MPNTHGFLIQFDEEQRTDFLRDVRGIEDGFSDALSSADWPLKEREVCGLLFKRDIITHWSLARSTRRVATGKVHVEFTNITRTNVPLAEIEKRIDSAIRQHIVRARSGIGGRVPPASWQALKDALREIDPASRGALDRLERLRDRSPQPTPRAGVEIVNQQRDATGLILDMFDSSRRLRNRVLEAWEPPRATDRLKSFLDGLPTVRTIEDQLIARDTVSFTGAHKVQFTVAGAVFDMGNRTLEVFNVNRHSIEEELGVDLIYLNDAFDAWTLVQYKLLEGDFRTKGGIYRVDPAFDKALKKMDRFRAGEPDDWQIKHGHGSYRLCGDGFYFKLCRRVQVEPLSTELLPGMYLPRLFIEAALADSTFSGPQGGRIISSENVARHLTNTIFADLVRDGWIGTRGIISSRIRAFLTESLTERRSLVFGRSRPRGVRADPGATLDAIGLGD